MTPGCYCRSILTSSIPVWCAAAVTKVLFNLSTHRSLPPVQTHWNCCSSALTVSGYCAAIQAHILGLVRNVIFMSWDTRYSEGWEQEAIWGVITEVNSMKWNCGSLFSLSLSLHPKALPSGPATITVTQKSCARSYSVRTVTLDLSAICAWSILQPHMFDVSSWLQQLLPYLFGPSHSWQTLFRSM